MNPWIPATLQWEKPSPHQAKREVSSVVAGELAEPASLVGFVQRTDEDPVVQVGVRSALGVCRQRFNLVAEIQQSKELRRSLSLLLPVPVTCFTSVKSQVQRIYGMEDNMSPESISWALQPSHILCSALT